MCESVLIMTRIHSKSVLIFSILGLSVLLAGFSFMPSVLAANANLFVSAENSQFNNYMAGPMVIEVIVIDSDISDTNEGEGEPDVTVQSKDLRMVQAVDGNWYGYFANLQSANAADATQTSNSGRGLDFGVGCTIASSSTVAGITLTEIKGVYFPNELTGVTHTPGILTDCSTITGTNSLLMHVVRESKSINTNPNTGTGNGQIDLADNMWPFIQLYDLNPTGDVVITYNKGGGAQSTTLTFDTVDQFAEMSLDRTYFPRSAHVHLTMMDIQLNIDPTDEDSWSWGTNSASNTAFYQLFDENGNTDADGTDGAVNLIPVMNTDEFMFEDNGILLIDLDSKGTGTEILRIVDNDDSQTNGAINIDASTVSTDGGSIHAGNQPVTFVEHFPNSGIFTNYDKFDVSNLAINPDAPRGSSATVDYNETPKSIVVRFVYGEIDIQPIDDEWNSGEEIPVVLIDTDANKNSREDEDLDFNNPNVDLIPTLQTGNPFTLASLSSVEFSGIPITTFEVQRFSDRAMLVVDNTVILTDDSKLVLIMGETFDDLYNSINNPSDSFSGFNFFNYDIRSINESYTFGTILSFDIEITDGTHVAKLADGVSNFQGLIALDNESGDDMFGMDGNSQVQLIFTFNVIPEFCSDCAINLNVEIFPKIFSGTVLPLASDFFSFGFLNDGIGSNERIANQIIRLELEESGDNTSTFEGSLEYVMINQLNILDLSTYEGLSTIAEDPTFIAIEDLTDEDSPRINYDDLGADGIVTQIADQEEAPSHTGVVSFDRDSYKIGEEVGVSLEDLDLNTDSDLIDIYTVVYDVNDDVFDQVGKANLPTDLSFGDLGRLLDITFNDNLWTTPIPNTCDSIGDGTGTNLEDITSNTGLGASGFTLVETDVASGTFIGDFEIPVAYCPPNSSQTQNISGIDIEVNYVDYRDASGEIIQVGDSTGIRSNTGSVSLDRTVYPIPFGVPSDFDNTDTSEIPNGRALFPIHPTGMSGDGGLEGGEHIADGDLTIHIRVNDPDFDISPTGEDKIAIFNADENVGPIKISVIRDTDLVVLAYAGNPTPIDGTIQVGTEHSGTPRQLGPIYEIAPDAGIFEIDVTIRYTDGPASSSCPITETYTSTDGDSDTSVTDRFENDDATNSNQYCILQGDILQVEYTDPADASGDPNTVTDSATFDLRNGVLQSDKSVYRIGSDMILTLIEPDFDLDSDGAETYDLDLIEWDSDAATTTMGDLGAAIHVGAFDPEPTDFRETGDSTGIFQIVIEIPQVLGKDNLERGEEITLEYSDWGPSLGNYVGEQKTDVNITIFTSNFGATVELDQKVYTWTDKVYITIVAPDHNFDSDLIDSIGETHHDPIKVSTRGFDLDNYELVETGTDTGIFTGEIILTGFCHDADGDPLTGSGSDACSTGDDTNPFTSADFGGPTDGFLESSNEDGLTVTFEFSEDETVVGSALIRWNIGEVQWLETIYPSSGTGIVRVIDSDMNLNPEAVDSFNIDVWSNYDAGGIILSVTETNEATGIFEGTVIFTDVGISSTIDGILRVSTGDTVAARYNDHTLPDPYTVADDIPIVEFTSIQGDIPPDDTRIIFDKDLYSWTDKVYITIHANEYNLDSNIVESIGNLDTNIRISTGEFSLNAYELVETGTNTGIFTGWVILTGFEHDADGDGTIDTNPITSGSGPTDGFIANDREDGISVTFEFSDDDIVVKSSLIRWNIGDIFWVNGDYSVNGEGTIRVIDSDMNLNPEAVDSFNVDVWSDSDAGGVDIVLTETNDATGIFEGVVNFTDEQIDSSGNLLRVSEDDTITVEYEDNTLPAPYTTSDELDLTATTIINDIIIPDTTISIETDKTVYSHDDIIYLTGDALPSPVNTVWNFDASDVKIVDAFGNLLETISVDQQVQFSSTLINNQNSEQPFAYLVRIQDDTDATISLAWITGSMSPGQTFSPALSWIPTEIGDYKTSIFFWKSIDDPIVLHPNISLTFNVGSDNSDQQIISTDDSTQIPISYHIQNQDNYIVTIGEILPDETGLFLEQIVPTSNLFSSFGEYTVTANYGIATSQTSFSLVPNLFCNDMTIDELIASGNYNVIDNRDGHLDGSKIKGTNGDDLILASDAGNDIQAKNGNDCVIGGAGNDKLKGDKGDDVIYGGNGNDEIRGGSGNDEIFGQDGNDKLKGDKGDDVLSCGVGTDTADGGKGTDTATTDCEKIKKVP